MTKMIKSNREAPLNENVIGHVLLKMSYAIFSVLLCLFLVCAHGSPFHTETIFTKIDEVANSISANRMAQSALKDMKVGKSGYYYLMDHEGTVLCHPNPSIEGINFSGIPMVKSILEKKSGCYIHFFDGREKIVIFRSAEPQGILCFTIHAEEVEGAGNHCQRFE